jgi:hypothetical protein
MQGHKVAKQVEGAALAITPPPIVWSNGEARIAIVGSAPSSRHFAPWGDSKWTIWACALSNIQAPRVDAHFELHSIDLLLQEPDRFLQYLEMLATKPVVYLAELERRIPGGRVFPRERMVQEFGPFFFSSTIAWMMALAILMEPKEIAIFGIDMTAEDEYRLQRPGCQYFIQKAHDRGIVVSAPVESDLLVPGPQYGYCEFSPFYRKMLARKKELEAKLNEVLVAKNEAMKQEALLRGGLAVDEYYRDTWGGLG